MNTKLLALAAIALVACSSPVGVPETAQGSTDASPATDAGPSASDAATPADGAQADAGADAATIVTTYGAGRVTVDSNGFTYDTAIKSECAFSKASDGVERCLPTQAGVVVVGFTADDCTGAVVSAPSDVTHVYFMDGSTVCQSSTPYATTNVLVAGDAGGCNVQSSLPAGNYFRCTSEITVSQFVASTELDK